jgi:hypothetical protein
MPRTCLVSSNAGHRGIEPSDSAPPAVIPPGYVGEFVMPGTGRHVWWTGRVAIGLRYQPQPRQFDAPSHSSLWLQDLLRGRLSRRLPSGIQTA